MPHSSHTLRLASVGVLVSVVAVATWWRWPSATARRDVPVIIYVIDTLRADRLGLYGHSSSTSPQIDALAAESVTFDHAYAPSPWTLPSVTSLMTSTFACEHGLIDESRKLSSSMKTLSERLLEAGYRTLGLYSNVFVGPVSGLDRGYETYEPHASDMANGVERLLGDVGDQPFLMYLHTMEPHPAQDPPYEYIGRFGYVRPEERSSYRETLHDYNLLRGEDWEARQSGNRVDNTDQQDRAITSLKSLRESVDVLYDASVLLANDHLNDVLNVLKRAGVWDEAIFVLASDHGDEFGEHGGWFHGQSVYNELAWIPLTIHFPGGQFGGRRINEPVSLVDVMPTILDYLGRPELCEDCRGSSLLPLLSDGARPDGAREPVTSIRINVRSYYRPWKEGRGDVNVLIRRGRWKGIWNDEPQALELYDLETDPSEERDVSEQNPQLTHDLSSHARRWLEDCRARQPSDFEETQLDEETREQLRAMGYVN